MGFDDQRYSLLLLQSLGLKPLEAGADPTSWTLRALFAPTFHHDCCVTLVSEGSYAVLEWIVLAKGARSAVMHAMGFRGFASPPGAPPMPKVALHEVVDVQDGPLAKFLAIVDAVNPYALPSVEAEGRDGMPVRCEAQRGPLIHRFNTWSPSPQRGPAHHRYLIALLDLVGESVHESRSQHSVAEVRTYLR